MPQEREAYAFGDFELDLAARSLTKSGIPVSLAPKTFDLLAMLVRRPGTLFSKREIIEQLWPDTFVEEANLSFQVAALRKALGENANGWIETVPKHGYRFRAPVERLNEPVGISTKSSPGFTTGPRRNLWRHAVVALVVAMAVLSAGWLIARRFRRSSPVLLMTPLNTYSGFDAEPSLSPDGSRVAFAWDGPSQDNLDIYVKVIGEDPPLRLTSDPRPEFSPVWSPDGRYIAFSREDEIVIVPAQGGPERVVVRGSADWIPDDVGSWFPDGSALGVVGHPVKKGPNGSGSQMGRTAIYGVSLANGQSWQLTFPPELSGDSLPKISPDGRQLAFERKPVHSSWPQLFSVPLTGDKLSSGDPVRLGADVIFGTNTMFIAATGLAWLPNSRTVLYTQSGRLWSVPVSSGVPKLLPLSGFHPTRLSISRIGRLVFMNESFDLDILRVPGPTNHEVSRKNRFPAPFISSTSPDSNPRFSPDGERIAFTSMRGGDGLQIWVCDSDGSNPVQLTHFADDNGSPRWSPDGRYLAFDSQEAGQRNIYIVSAEGGPARRFTSDASQKIQKMPSWSRDGHWIYFGSNRTGQFEQWKAPLQSGSPTQVTREGGDDALESPDGKFLYYTKEDQPGIWRQPVGGGREQLVVDHGESLFWDMYDRGLCLLNLESHPPRVECLDFTSHTLSTVFSLPDDHRIWGSGPSFAVSPDGQWVLYSHVESADNSIMSVDNISEAIRY